MLEEQAMITFLKKFDEHPFLVKINGHEHLDRKSTRLNSSHRT